jgi:soluble lytic murein transglycosylase-like protein
MRPGAMPKGSQSKSRSRRPAFAWLAAGLWLCAGSASATVLEIGSDGAVVRYDQPTQYLTPAFQARPLIEGMRPSVAPPRARRSAARATVSSALATASHDSAIHQDLLDAVAWRESAYRPNAVSPKGAVGVMQLMPATARALGVDPADGGANVRGGARYLRALLTRYDGDIVKTLAAYNAGPAAVDRYRGAPPFAETRAFIGAIMDRLADRAVDPHRSSNGNAP